MVSAVPMVTVYAMTPSGENQQEPGLAHLRAQTEATPDNPKSWHHLGQASETSNLLEDAVRAFARAAQLDPEWPAPCFGLARALARLNQDDAAITAYRTALALAPEQAEAHFALARLLEKRGAASDAVAHFSAAALQKPDWAKPHLYKGSVHEARGQYTEARLAYERGVVLGAPAGFALRARLQVPIIPADAASYAHARAVYEEELDRFLAAPPGVNDPIREAGGNRFFLAYHGLDDRPFQEKLARLMRTACPTLSWTAPHCIKPGAVTVPRRVGIASRFLHDHSIGRLMIGLLARLNARSDCRVHLFHATTPQDDALRREIEDLADTVAVLPGDLQTARETIAAARLDILFYPDIGMDPVTYFLAQARLAPVQAATWGHPVTTGIPTIDYYLSCDAAEPEGAEAHYTEHLVRLGGLPFSYRRPARPDPLGTRTSFGLPEEATIYFLAQNLFKIHPNMDAPLAAILERDPAGIIFLLEGQDRNWGAQLRQRFEETIGANAARIRFLPRQPHDGYMQLLTLSDVSLDSFPFCGGNTTYQALAMGTPVVTLPGDYLRGRLSLAIYRHLGVMDCVAGDAEEFADIAVRLGTEPAFRDDVVGRIRNNCDKIFDDPIFLEDAERFLLHATPPGP